MGARRRETTDSLVSSLSPHEAHYSTARISGTHLANALVVVSKDMYFYVPQIMCNRELW